VQPHGPRGREVDVRVQPRPRAREQLLKHERVLWLEDVEPGAAQYGGSSQIHQSSHASARSTAQDDVHRAVVRQDVEAPTTQR
jgi:hypothetical protein